MQIFQEVQKSFNSLGFNAKLEPLNRRILSILATVFPAVIFVWIFLIHEANTAQEYMESIYIVTAATGIFLSFASTIFIAKKLFLFIDSFDEYINERSENPTSRAIFEETNEFVEKWSKIGIFSMKCVVVPCYICPKAIISFYIYFTTDLGNNAFDLPIRMWFPYEWKNPVGYLVTVLAQFFLALYPSEYIGCLALLAFGVFMFSIAIVKTQKNELDLINQMESDEKSRKGMYKRITKSIRVHANAKQITTSFLDLYEITLTIVFISCVITVCSALLLVQIEISHNETNSIVLLEAVVFGATALILLLFVCELGQRFSNGIDEIYDELIQMDWYLFPSELQRVFPTIIICTQEPPVVKCFGNVLCARKQFFKVVKTIYSYFMTLRTFYK